MLFCWKAPWQILPYQLVFCKSSAHDWITALWWHSKYSNGWQNLLERRDSGPDIIASYGLWRRVFLNRRTSFTTALLFMRPLSLAKNCCWFDMPWPVRPLPNSTCVLNNVCNRAKPRCWSRARKTDPVHCRCRCSVAALSPAIPTRRYQHMSHRRDILRRVLLNRALPP